MHSCLTLHTLSQGYVIIKKEKNKMKKENITQLYMYSEYVYIYTFVRFNSF